MTRRIRKQCFELQLSDLERFPSWEFALDEEGRDGQDEATVRPVELRRGRETEAGPCIVLAVFEFPNGRVRLGQLTIGAGDDVGGAQPSLFTDRGQLSFYDGAGPIPKRELRRRLRVLRTIAKNPFPIHVHSSLRDKRGSPLFSGVLKGFYRWGGFDRPPKRVTLA